MLPQRVPKERPREDRWRSPAHTKFVTEFACAMCGSRTNRIAAHVRFGSHTAMGRKPDDWRTVPLCDGPFANIDGQAGCHNVQHLEGEPSFWRRYAKKHGQTVEQLISELIKASPKRAEIERIRKERSHAA